MSGAQRPAGRRQRKRLAVSPFLGLAFALSFFAYSLEAAEQIPPAPADYFNDYAHVVNAAEADRLNAQLRQFERDTSEQIVVAIFPKMESDSSIDDYSERVFTAWGIGQKNNNNGALVLVFVADRNARIQTGYGLEGALPDITCWHITREIMGPRFKNGDYQGGLEAGISAILVAARDEYKGNGQIHQSFTASDATGVAVILLIVLAFNFIGVRVWGWGFLFREAGWVINFALSCASSGRGSSGGGFSGGGGRSGGGGATGSW